MVATTPNLPITQTSQGTTQCATCSALGRPCPTLFPPAHTVSPHHSNWSDKEESEDLYGEKTRGKREEEQKEKELELQPKS